MNQEKLRDQGRRNKAGFLNCRRGLNFPLSSVLFFNGYVIHVLVRCDIQDARLSAATEIEPTTRLLGNFSTVSFSKTGGPNP